MKKADSHKKEFLREIEMLIHFFNNFHKKKNEWFSKLELTKKEQEILTSFSNEYAKRKINLENQIMPKYESQVIMIENAVIKTLFQPEIMKIKGTSRPKKAVESVLKFQHENAVILDTKDLEELAESLKEKSMNMTDFLVFDRKLMRIIGIEIEKA